jgi:glycosyltransferase involved in cell wall biosynthesis
MVELGPLVSVITPCYNAGSFIAHTIDSVSSQTYSPVEHIVVDDASSDSSWDNIVAAGSRVLPLRLSQNRGGSFARNRGVERARGEFLMFLDADDVLAPTAIEALVRAVGDQPLGIAYCGWQRLRWSGDEWLSARAEIPLPVPGADHLAGWLSGSWVPPCAMLWRRDAYELAGEWDESLVSNQDGDLSMRALARGARLILAQREPLAWYRMHSSARTTVSAGTYTRTWLESQVRVLDKLAAELQGRGTGVPYASAIGFTYRHFGRLGTLHGHAAVADHCFVEAQRWLGQRARSGSSFGRLLDLTLGMTRKERLAILLARAGLGSAIRREFIAEHRAPHSGAGWKLEHPLRGGAGD